MRSYTNHINSADSEILRCKQTIDILLLYFKDMFEFSYLCACVCLFCYITSMELKPCQFDFTLKIVWYVNMRINVLVLLFISLALTLLYYDIFNKKNNVLCKHLWCLDRQRKREWVCHHFRILSYPQWYIYVNWHNHRRAHGFQGEVWWGFQGVDWVY